MSNNTNVSISDLVENYFCILSNLFCFIPTYLHFRNNNFYDCLYIFVTGITSVFYHLNNNNNSLINILDPLAIKLADIVLSDLLIIQTVTYVAFYKNYNLRAAILFYILPFQIYVCIIDNIYRTIFTFSNLAIYTLFVLYLFYKYSLFGKYPFFIFCIAVSINGIELLCYEYLQKNINYNIYHGIHHICAFLSIAVYYYVPIYINNYKLVNSIKINKTENINVNNTEETSLDDTRYNNIEPIIYDTPRVIDYHNYNNDISNSRDNLLNWIYL